LHAEGPSKLSAQSSTTFSLLFSGLRSPRAPSFGGQLVIAEDDNAGFCFRQENVGEFLNCLFCSSGEPDCVPTRPGIGADGPAADYFGPVHFPDGGLAGVRVLPQDVGMAVVIEIARSDRALTLPGIGAHRAAAD
jgi:hypothetical protein